MAIKIKNIIILLIGGLSMISFVCIGSSDTSNIFMPKPVNNEIQSYFHIPSDHTAFFNFTENTLGQESFLQAEAYKAAINCDSALYFYENASKHFELSGDLASYGRCLVRCSEMYLTLRDFEQADEKLSIAEALIENESLDLNILHAEVHHTRGIYLIKTGQSKASLNHLIESIDIRNVLNGDYDAQLANTYNKLGVNYYILGNFEKALSCYNQALTIIEYNENEPGLVDAEVYNNIGIVLKLKGDFITAMDYYHRSLEIKEKILQPDDPNLARTYNNVGNLSRMMGESGLAMNYYENAVDILIKKFGLRYPMLGKIYTNLGILYKDNGDYAKALQYLNQALNIFDKKINREEISSVYNNIGNVYYELNDFEKALSYYQKSVSIRETDKTKFLARSYSNFALCYDRLDRIEESEKYHNLAIESRIKYYGNDHYLLASEYMNYGQACIDRNEKEKGINLYQEALAIYKDNYGDKHPKTSNCLVNIGDYYLDDHNIIQSLHYYQQALIAIVEDFDFLKEVDENPDIFGNVLSKLDLLHALERKANALNENYSVTHNLQDLESSIATYQLAIDLIDNIRIGHLSRDSKLALAKNQKDLFISAIRVASDAYEVTNDLKYQELAFNTAERGKAGMLYDLIRETNAKHFAHIPDSLLEIERNLKENITLYKNFVHNELLKASAQRDNDKLNLWEEKVFHLQAQQNELVEHFNHEYPKYYQYKYTNKIYTTKEIRDYLTENDALIEYFVGDSSLYAFCLTKNDITVVEQKIDESFFQNIDNLPNNQSINAVINDAYTIYSSYVNSSYDLYKVLLAPFETEVAGKSLIIIPDGKLGYVSFESLLTDATDSKKIDYRNLPYLINDHAISYGYSSTLLVNSGDVYHSHKAQKDLLAFAPVTFNEENALYTQPVKYRTRGEELMDLPATRKEVIDINSIFGGDVYLDSEATVSRFKEVAADYKILHIATHGIMDDDDPMHSKLMFSPVDNKNDDCLYYGDLFNLELNAELAVLSACNTGSGKNSEGEGVIAFARGFMYSGVPSMVISLWKVEDESTAEIMKYFYANLKQGYSKDEALRSAKIEYLKNTDNIGASPYYWSGFINIGNKEPLHFNHHNKSYFWLLLLLLPAPVFIFRRRAKSKSN